MFIATVISDLRKAVEELSAGLTSYVLIVNSSVTSIWVIDKISAFVFPLTVAYLAHKLKKNYWDNDRPFFKNIIKDIRTWLKEKK